MNGKNTMKLNELNNISSFLSDDTPCSDFFYLCFDDYKKEKRGIWLLPVRYSRPTTALVVNRQSDTHAIVYIIRP